MKSGISLAAGILANKIRSRFEQASIDARIRADHGPVYYVYDRQMVYEDTSW